MKLGDDLSPWSVVPFAGLLVAIALLPLVAPHFWHRDRNKAWISALGASPVALYLIAGFGAHGFEQLGILAHEYVSFIALLGSLFVVTGGVHVRGDLSATPALNTAVLGAGALLANAIGTTGASVLLIRPLMAANAQRRSAVHVAVFFIMIVSNCGGLLTPLGDPPLFLGFLRGVPFGWTLSLWRPWMFVNGALLALFCALDRIAFAREGGARAAVRNGETLGVDGAWNFAALLAIVALIYASGSGLGNGGVGWPFGIAEAGMLALAGLSWIATGAEVRRRNRFGFGPINEVAILFAGLFVTMTPALLLLNADAAQLGVRSPAQFFWATGLLSGVLDNAPTYLAFAAMACGLEGIPLEGRPLAEFLARGAAAERVLGAISCGAVFMGALSYIGNGPNLMVKAIAEERGVRMPGFFGYMLYSGAVLIPLCALAVRVFL